MTLLAPLRRRPFRLLFAARATSLLGTALAPTALAFAVIAVHGSPTILGVVVAAAIVPYVLFALVGRAVGDRLPRHLVMVASDLVSGAVQAAAGALLLARAAGGEHRPRLRPQRHDDRRYRGGRHPRQRARGRLGADR
jgi:MFS family permease